MTARNQSRNAIGLPLTNPFATKRIRAGAIPYRFVEPGDSMNAFRRQLTEASWRGQIVGKHGTGKTTLLRALESYWQDWGRDHVTLTKRSCWDVVRMSSSWTPATQVVADGFECYGSLRRFLVVSLSRVRNCGLLVTSHTPNGLLPVVHRTSVSERLAEELVLHLTKGELPFDAATIRQHYRAQDANLRETFLSLYDEVTSRSVQTVDAD